MADSAKVLLRDDNITKAAAAGEAVSRPASRHYAVVSSARKGVNVVQTAVSAQRTAAERVKEKWKRSRDGEHNEGELHSCSRCRNI